MSRKRFIVRGVVQGVNFRYATFQQARLLRLSGTVRNRDDGAVEAEDLPGEPQHRGFAIG